MRWFIAVIALVLFSLAQGLSMTSNFWLTKWTDGLEEVNDTAAHQYKSLSIYATFGTSFGKLRTYYIDMSV